MVFDLSRHPFFTRWDDPLSKIPSYILTKRVAPFQKSMYYTTPGISADGRWLWFYAAYPPNPIWSLAAVSLDPDTPQIHIFPQCTGGGNPRLTKAGDSAYVIIRDGIYLLQLDGSTQEIFRLPQEVLQNRFLFRVATTLTLSADERYFVLDSRIGNRFLISLVESATGAFKPLRWFFSEHHHAMFSKTDPHLIMLGQGPFYCPITGEKGDMNVRMWLMNTNLTQYEPLFGDLWFNQNCLSCHEWWMPSGKIAWCDYKEGIYVTDPYRQPRERRLLWAHGLCHADCDRTERYFVGDEDPYRWSAQNPCRIFFFDSQTGKEIALTSGLPEMSFIPSQDRRAYHLDPHPQFSPDGSQICYTTSALGTVNVAVAAVRDILERM